MNISSDQTDDGTPSSILDFVLARRVWLILLSILIGPSVAFALLIAYWLLKIRALWTRMSNHLIIALFVLNFLQATFEVPLVIAYLAVGYVPFASYGFCKFWICFDFTFGSATLALTVLLSIERYLLIFHRNLLHRHKILMHYVPIGVALLASAICSCSAILFYPCAEAFDYTIQLCGGPCYQVQPLMGTVDVTVSVFLPLSLITLFNVLLTARVLMQKRRMQQTNIWRKNVCLLIQLLSITFLHWIVLMPTCVVIIVSLVAVPAPLLVQELQADWILFNLIYIAVLGSPFTCAFALPELKGKIGRLTHSGRRLIPRNRVTAMPMTAIATAQKHR